MRGLAKDSGAAPIKKPDRGFFAFLVPQRRNRGQPKKVFIEAGSACMGLGRGLPRSEPLPPCRQIAEGDLWNKRGRSARLLSVRQASRGMAAMGSWKRKRARRVGRWRKRRREAGSETAFPHPNLKWPSIDGCRSAPLRRIASALAKDRSAARARNGCEGGRERIRAQRGGKAVSTAKRREPAALTLKPCP